MDWLHLSFVVILITILEQKTLSIKSDLNVGSNWYVPNRKSGSSNPITIPPPNGDSSFPYPFHNSNESKGASSSLIPTVAVTSDRNVYNYNLNESNRQSGTAVDYSNYYYPPQSSAVGTPIVDGQYQYYQYNPDTSSYHIYPVPDANTPVLEQKQEFGADSDEGGIFGGLPSLGDIAGGIGSGLSGIATAVGLGGLGFLGAIIVAVIGLPLLILIILFPIALLVIGILGFPVLQVTLPPSDSGLGRAFKKGISDTANSARQVLESEECVERLSCILAKRSRKLPYENWILSKLGTVSNPLASRLSKSVKSGRAGENCEQFKCSPAMKFKRLMDSFGSRQNNKHVPEKAIVSSDQATNNTLT